MKIIYGVGRLGNQMVYYANALYLEKICREEVKFDLSALNNLSFLHRWELISDTWTLDNVFHLKIKYSHYWENQKLRGFYLTILRRDYDFADLEKKIFKKNRIFKKKVISHFTTMQEVADLKEDAYLSLPIIIDLPLFSKIHREIIAAFQFPKLIDKRNIKIGKEIKNKHSISIHLRNLIVPKLYNNKTHQLEAKEETRKLFHHIKKAISILQKKISQPTYYIFYDSPVIKEKFIQHFVDIKNVVFVDWNRKDFYIDMQLMSLCPNNILTHGTFSWWVGYLNQNKNKIVLYPNPDEFKALPKSAYPKEWICIN